MNRTILAAAAITVVLAALFASTVAGQGAAPAPPAATPKCVGVALAEARIFADQPGGDLIALRAFEDGSTEYRIIRKADLRSGSTWTKLAD
jgi:hypothetical protein